MRLILLFCALSIFSGSLFARDNLLLHCLGREEDKFHKEKIQSAVSRLNQNFINELSTSNDLAIKKNYIDEICNPKAKFPPAVGLLRLLLIKENDIFDLSLSGVDPSMRSYKMAYIKEFQKQVPHIFINYLAGIQADMPNPHCLERAIPEIAVLNERLKYLEDEIPIHEVLGQKKKLENIFNKLINIKSIKIDCEKNPLGTGAKKKAVIKF